MTSSCGDQPRADRPAVTAWTVTRAAPGPSAPAPCTRRTSRASSRRPRPFVPRAPRVQPRRGAAQRLRQVARRGVRRVARHAPGEPRRDLLQDPAVAVGIAEGDERSIGAAVGSPAVDAAVVTRVPAPVPLRAVEHRARVDAGCREVRARGVDVGHDQVQALDRAGRDRDQALPELDRASGARGRELDPAGAEVGVEPPPQSDVEPLRPVDVRHGDRDDLELHVRLVDDGGPTRVDADLGLTHLGLLERSSDRGTPSRRSRRVAPVEHPGSLSAPGSRGRTRVSHGRDMWRSEAMVRVTNRGEAEQSCAHLS
jgi:hypothetical protein